MVQALRLIVFNAEEAFGSTLRRELLAFDGIKIIAEIDEAALLPEAVERFPVDLLLVHLDPFPEPVLEVVAAILRERPDLACFALSESRDGELILAAMRAGVREFLTKPLDREELGAALEKLWALKPQKVHQGKLVSVIGVCGGLGATTLAVNLAVEMAQLDVGKVALVDLDFRFGQVATFLDLQPNFTIADLCDTPEQVDPQMIEKAVVKHASGVHVLARPHQFAQAEQITAAHAASVLSALQEVYSFVVIDGPMRYDASGRIVLEMADLVLLVMQLLVPSVRNADRILQELSREGYNLDRLKLLCNRVGRESGHLEVDHIEATLNQEVFAKIAEDWRLVSDTINTGEPLCTAAPRSKVRQDILHLAKRIAQAGASAKEPDEASQRGASAGIFSKLFSSSKHS